ncbi:MAG TPA: contractile injection system protein, VgrG/Pvc8 family [Anaerolineae bacterium]|nr:contractile injection system protein, VgrG/Pvc8 family [Anaerolineae bacterium]HMR64195.1 contractile injection system protein, VgrG/Pvc8 family [Anaerolineae bacterium]
MAELGVPSGIVTAEAALTIEGEAQPRLNAGLLSLIVEETTEGLYRCEARFGNWGSGDYLYFDRSLLDFGKKLTVTMGSDEAEAQIFQGVISALEGQFLPGEPPQLVVLAEDAAQALRLTRRSRTFEEISDAGVFEQIANEHGLQAEIDLPGPAHRVIAQLNQSDLAFMRERAQRLAAEIWVEGNSLYAQSRPNRQQGGDELSLQFNRGLLEFSVTADTANQYTKVIASGWDVQAKESLAHEATDSVLGNELNGDQSGASIVSAAFGERTERLARRVPLTPDEVQALAEAAFRAQARRFVVGTGLARGDGRLRVGRLVQLQGLGPLFSGAYYMTEVRHIFGRGPAGGYTTEFVAERPGLGR